MNRRTAGRLALAGTAAAALATGAWWQQRRAATTANEAQGTLWQLRFAQLDGSELAMASLKGRPLLLNFWGTWCPPCVAEMPELDRFARDHASAGWRVLGLAVDSTLPVREFLANRPVGYSIALAGFEGAGLSRELGNHQGGLPFTVAFNAAGLAVHHKAGQTSYAELQRWALQM
jgi:thiol-disulfide isomerase/thioredoxin